MDLRCREPVEHKGNGKRIINVRVTRPAHGNHEAMSGASGAGSAIALFGIGLIAPDALLALFGWIVVATTLAQAGYATRCGSPCAGPSESSDAWERDLTPSGKSRG